LVQPLDQAPFVLNCDNHHLLPGLRHGGKDMTALLTFHQLHLGGRILLKLGQHEVGAVFPPPQETTLVRPQWRWSWWLCGYLACREGRAKSEQAAKDELLTQGREWLKKAGLE
jgi:hypothetical protein